MFKLWKQEAKHPDGMSSRVSAREAATLKVVACLRTDAGCQREVNEDSVRYVKPNDPELSASRGELAIVADGMGGALAGEVASRIAVEAVARAYYEKAGEAQRALKLAFIEANRQLYKASISDESLRGMGTTCTALVLREGTAFAAYVGDSRLYLLRRGQIYLMTEDHSAVMEMVKHGVITMQEARHHTDKNIILRALGVAPAIEVATWESSLQLQDGDQYLLCTDGLYDVVEDEEIKEVMSCAPDPQDSCGRLIALARERGGPDNITAAIIALRSARPFEVQSVRATCEVEIKR